MADWTEKQKLQVWKKGHIIYRNHPIYGKLPEDPKMWRRDDCGNRICFSDYGDTKSPFGWEIDHIVRESEGGGNELTNLRPLHWEANRRRG